MLTKFMASLAVLGAGALFAAGAAHARDLPNFDILEGMAASAPLNKAAQALPDGVERVSRDSRLGVPEFLWFKPAANTGASRRPVTDAATAGPIDASASFETLQRIAELIPTEWLDAVAKGSPQDCAKTIARQYDLGVHSVIMHGASPHELAPVVEAYRADRPTLHRAVAANPGRFA